MCLNSFSLTAELEFLLRGPCLVLHQEEMSTRSAWVGVLGDCGVMNGEIASGTVFTIKFLPRPLLVLLGNGQRCLKLGLKQRMCVLGLREK